MDFRHIPCLLAAAALCITTLGTAAAFADTTYPTPEGLVGQVFTPPGNIVLYSRPEDGLIARRRARTLVTPTNGSVTMYPLKQQGADYITGKPSTAPMLTITGQRQIVDGTSITHWLKVTGSGLDGWVRYDPAVLGTMRPKP